MKRILLFLTLLVLTASSKAQRFFPPAETGVAVGLSGGFASNNCFVANYGLGTMLHGQNHLSLNLEIFSKIRSSDIPSIFEARMGHSFSGFEVYGGAGYHMLGHDGSKIVSAKEGIKPAYGVIKHFDNSIWTVGAGMSGSIFSLQLGIFGIR
jgi:hypothetical protein